MKIVVLDGYTLNPGDNPWDEVAAFGEFTVYDRTPSDLIEERAAEAEIVLTNKTPLMAKTLAKLGKLKLICVLATGYNVVDLERAAAMGVPVVNVPEYGSDSVAQHALALLLELTNRVGHFDEAVKGGEWSQSRDFTLLKAPITELAGKTLGIVGLGHIGSRFALVAQALGMKIVAYNPRSRHVAEGLSVEWVTLEELFRRSNVISLHCPLNEENRGFVNSSLLELLPPHSYILNTARGPLVNEHDLAEALNSGALAGAGLDVTAREPIAADSPLLTAKNCIITPHVAWASLSARKRLMAITAQNVASFLAGKPQNVVNGV
ncbi:D-2-hydroxyacid dehydrogenase [Geomonas sp. RF6]|uniref:D-2-hydroxyacid dehydrogenase n=1 Tax=Geomonas sp. RF6 TaxID=2897342 RepID=UPI001E3D4A12|nr:D-2-hydroxyacid dehydrogenase [Geomonas sp. RF6]UFS71284.1 D-2-hydroxyacid dehydrogenase [Geomonas sp. RF6]